MEWQKKWEAIEKARKLLRVPIITTRREIIEKYYALAKEHHPDKGGNSEMMKELNEAYQLLMQYCDNYKIEFKPNVDTIDPADFWFQHFGEDPIWASSKKESDKERS